MLKRILVTFIVLDILNLTYGIDGLIWSKNDQDFIPLFSVSDFWIAQNRYLKGIYELERHNFNKEILKVAYYQETNLVSFVDNDTKISGVCGELWTILADYLNFTLIPIKLANRNFGIEYDNGSYDGLLGLIQQNQSEIIARTALFVNHLPLLEYTMPIWRVRYHIYIKPEWTYDSRWVVRLFNKEVWYGFFIIIIILCLAGYAYDKLSANLSIKKVHFTLQDHVLYTIAVATSQGSVPDNYNSQSRILYICTSLFSWIVMIAFSSHAIYLMTHRKYLLPFYNLKSLFFKSKYNLMIVRGSMVQEKFEETIAKILRTEDYKRIDYAATAHELYEKICFSGDKSFAVFEAEDRHKAIGKFICKLIPTRASYFETWIASAVKRGFQYKRSFDIGILKMSEAGIIDALKERWLDWKLEEIEKVPVQSIDMSQVKLMFGILVVGFVVSSIIFLIEYLTFFITNLIRNNNNPKVIVLKMKQ